MFQDEYFYTCQYHAGHVLMSNEINRKTVVVFNDEITEEGDKLLDNAISFIREESVSITWTLITSHKSREECNKARNYFLSEQTLRSKITYMEEQTFYHYCLAQNYRVITWSFTPIASYFGKSYGMRRESMINGMIR